MQMVEVPELSAEERARRMSARQVAKEVVRRFESTDPEVHGELTPLIENAILSFAAPAPLPSDALATKLEEMASDTRMDIQGIVRSALRDAAAGLHSAASTIAAQAAEMERMRADEREECAKVADGVATRYDSNNTRDVDAAMQNAAAADAAYEVAAFIRARSHTETE